MERIRLLIINSKELCATSPEQLEYSLASNGFLVCTDAKMTDSELVKFAGQFGVLYLPTAQNRHHTIPELFIVKAGGQTGKVWHADIAFTKSPPRYTFLKAVEVPEKEGKTALLDTRIFLKEIDFSLRKRLATYKGIFSFQQIFEKKMKRRGLALTEEQQTWPDVSHDLVQPHPLTGELCLIFHEEYLVGIEGLNSEQSEQIIQSVINAMEQWSKIYFHTWSGDELLIWDNRVMLHKGYPTVPGCARRLHRVIVW